MYKNWKTNLGAALTALGGGLPLIDPAWTKWGSLISLIGTTWGFLNARDYNVSSEQSGVLPQSEPRTLATGNAGAKTLLLILTLWLASGLFGGYVQAKAEPVKFPEYGTPEHQAALQQALNETIAKNPEAMQFIAAYGSYVEMIDDLVDESQTLEHIQRISAMSNRVFSMPYWQKHLSALQMVEYLTNITYFDSVQWERSGEAWKIKDARCLSHCGYNMLFAVILIESGFEKLREVSLLFRENAHLAHINDEFGSAPASPV